MRGMRGKTWSHFKTLCAWPFLPSGLRSKEIAVKFHVQLVCFKFAKRKFRHFPRDCTAPSSSVQKNIKTAVNKGGTGTWGLMTRGREAQGHGTRGRGTRGLGDVLEDFINKQHMTFPLNF